jgi:hypothetical protein
VVVVVVNVETVIVDVVSVCVVSVDVVTEDDDTLVSVFVVEVNVVVVFRIRKLHQPWHVVAASTGAPTQPIFRKH